MTTTDPDQYRTTALLLPADVLDGSSDGVCTIDRQWRITYTNPAALAHLGCSAAELLGRELWAIYPQLCGTPLETGLRAAMADRQPWHAELPAITTGHWHRFQVTPSPDGLVVIFTDTTACQQVYEALQRSEAHFRELLTVLPAAVYACNANGTMQYYNERAAAIWGQAPALGDPASRYCGAYRLYRPDGSVLPHDETAMVQVIREGIRIRDQEVTVERPDGSRRQIMVNIEPLRDEQGAITGAINAFIDITERQHTEQARRESEARFHTLADATFEAIAIHAGGVLLDANEQFLRMHGYTLDEVIGQPIAQFIVPEDRPRAMAAADRATDACSEYRNVRKDGSIFPVEAQGRSINLSGRRVRITAIRDITVRKHAEAALRESDARFRVLIDSMDNIAVQGYRGDGTVAYWNRANEAVYGYTAEEAIGHNLVDLIIPPPMRDFVRAAIRDGAETGAMPPAAEMELMRKDGSLVPVYSSHVIVRMPDREPELFCLDVDLTERKRAEAASQRSEARYRQLVEQTTAIILRVDSDGMIRFANERAFQFFGYTADELLNRHVVGTIVPPRDSYGCDLVDMVQRIVVDPDRFHTNANENMRKNGERVWVEWTNSGIYDADGSLREVLTVGIDVTERNAAEVALRESEAQFRLLAEMTQDGIAIIQDGRLAYANPFLCQRGGYQEAEVLGRPFAELIHPDHRAMLLDYHQRRLQDEDVPSRYEAATMAKDGTHAGWFDFQIKPIAYRERPAFLINAHEITARKQWEDSLRAADRAKDEFLAVLSHELQTPLTAMLGWASEALRAGTPELLATAMPIVYRNAVRQKRLVDDLLEISRLLHQKIVFHKEAIDGGEQVTQAVENIQQQAAGRQLHLVYTPPTEALPLFADPARVQQCLGNVLSNSLKFTPAGGTITVSCQRAGDQAVITVADTGRGIAPEALPAIFQIFTQVNRDERAGGLGLGLAITRGILELHGGGIEAESDGLGCGSRLILTFPLALGTLGEYCSRQQRR